LCGPAQSLTYRRRIIYKRHIINSERRIAPNIAEAISYRCLPLNTPLPGARCPTLRETRGEPPEPRSSNSHKVYYGIFLFHVISNAYDWILIFHDIFRRLTGNINRPPSHGQTFALPKERRCVTSWIASWRLISTSVPSALCHRPLPLMSHRPDQAEMIASRWQMAGGTERDAGGNKDVKHEVLLDERSSESSPWVPTARPCREICPKTAGCKSLVFPMKAGNKPDRNG
jgi:hypothetical protein